jgi:FdhD protein
MKPIAPGGTERKKLWRWERGESPRREADEVAEEEPLEIRVAGQPVSVTMRTPGHDPELAVGFLLSEGLIRAAADVASVTPARAEPGCNVINVEPAAGVKIDLAQLTRHVFASSSCGLCGKATIAAVHRHFPPLDTPVTVSAPMLLQLPERSRVKQATFERTGGLHAAAVFDESGDLIVLREDVGRHNAVDKVLGYGLMNGMLPFSRHVLLVSGRASFEILQKALAGRIPIVAAVSAPSSLAVQFAEESGQTLVAFLRGARMNIYAGRERIRFRER